MTWRCSCRKEGTAWKPILTSSSGSFKFLSAQACPAFYTQNRSFYSFTYFYYYIYYLLITPLTYLVTISKLVHCLLLLTTVVSKTGFSFIKNAGHIAHTARCSRHDCTQKTMQICTSCVEPFLFITNLLEFFFVLLLRKKLSHWETHIRPEHHPNCVIIFDHRDIIATELSVACSHSTSFLYGQCSRQWNIESLHSLFLPALRSIRADAPF